MRASQLRSPSAARRLPLATLAAAAATLSALGGLIAGAADTAPADSASGAPPAVPAPGSAPGPVAVPAYRQANTVAILTVDGFIDLVTLRSLERRVEQARKAGANAIVFRLDTPGGEMQATLDICHLIKNGCPPNTVAWVDHMAFSAGTYIALACREIVMAPNSRIGDAAPVVFGGSLAPTERAKAESPLLSEAIDSARRNHYDENLVKAFVTLSPDLWLLENDATGQRVVVDSAEYERVMGAPPPATASPPTISAGSRPVSPLISRLFQGAPRPGATPEQQAQQAEFEQQLPPVRQPLTELDRGQWRLVHQVIPAGRLLTLTTEEAAYYGLSAATIANVPELKAWFGATRILEYDESWSEALVRFLVSNVVRAVLLVVFLVSLFIELSIPGVGVFGATALVALLLLVGAPLLVGLAQWWEILLILAGLGLIAAELFVIPGFGVAGVTGALCLIVGLVGTFVAGDPGTAEGRSEMLQGAVTTVVAMVAAGISVWLISRRLESMPWFRRFTLTAEIATPAAGAVTVAGEGQRVLAPGDVGSAATDLRPSGRGQFGNRLVDVQSVVGYVERGTPIRVVSVNRFEIEVEVAR